MPISSGSYCVPGKQSKAADIIRQRKSAIWIVYTEDMIYQAIKQYE